MAKEIFRFYDYIEKRINTPLRNYNPIVQDLVEDMKYDIEYDKGITKDMTAQEIVNHILWQGACQGCLEALEKLIKQYKHYCRSIDMGYEKVSCRK